MLMRKQWLWSTNVDGGRSTSWPMCIPIARSLSQRRASLAESTRPFIAPATSSSLSKRLNSPPTPLRDLAIVPEIHIRQKPHQLTVIGYPTLVVGERLLECRTIEEIGSGVAGIA